MAFQAPFETITGKIARIAMGRKVQENSPFSQEAQKKIPMIT
jgi:hypothetical protein